MINAGNNKLTVYSASAGSGKTFSLTVEYVSKLLKNPKAYRSILAVTFTNKATAEMKSRILSVLWNLVYEPQKAQAEIDTIKGAKNSELSEIEKKNASFALSYILHDYNHFWIETIDTFFQRVLRNMAREIGVSSGFELLLNDDDFIAQAVEELKEDTRSDKDLKDCLQAFIDERMRQGKKWNYERDMKQFARNLSKDIIIEALERMQSESMQDILRETEKADVELKIFLEQMNAFIATAKQYAIEAGKPEAAFVYSDFKNGYTFANDKKTDGNIIKTSKKSEDRLFELRDRCTDYYNINFEKAKCLYVVYASARKLCLLKFISQREHELLKENNSFLLAHTQKLLNRMVVSEDIVPFMYERIGSRLQHIMIDEFQDTSLQAWKNFEFLLKECLSIGGDCAVFGDVKQSIYRWNDGDWHILKNLYDKPNNNDYKLSCNPHSLSDNYRTDANIVEFNNRFFGKVFKDIAGFAIEPQTPKKELGQGELRFNFVKKEKEDDADELVMAKTVEEIDYFLDQGYDIGDIVLLFRNRDKARKMAKYLKDLDNSENRKYKYNPCSLDAFALDASAEVRKIIYLLRYISDRKDTVAAYWLKNFTGLENLDGLKDSNQVPLSLIDTVLGLIRDFGINSDDTFVMAFCDKLISYCSRNGNDIRRFLSYWSDKMHEESVTVKKDKNSLELQTIHKSKGLEYDVVIVPFCDWNMIDNRHTVWQENFATDKAVKVFETSLKSLRQMGIAYAEMAAEEEWLQQIDNINLLYVAFTRPKHSLSMVAQSPSKADLLKEIPSKVSAIVYNHLISVENCTMSAESETSGDTTVVLGMPTPKKQDAKAEETILNPFLQRAETLQVKNKSNFGFEGIDYALSKAANDYFDKLNQEKENAGAKWGKLLHGVLSRIKTEADLPRALSGLNVDDAQAVKPIIESMLSDVKEKHWFDGTFRVMNERSIADSSAAEGETVKRPDRVMIRDNKAIVVDYKFIKSADSLSRYHDQIKEYGRRLRTMGFGEVELYLWAVESESDLFASLPESINRHIVQVAF